MPNMFEKDAAFTVFLAGGGVKAGFSYGATDEVGRAGYHL